MVLALAPHRVVEDAQALQRLVERARAARGHLGERLGHFREALFGRRGAVAVRKLQHGRRGEDRVAEERDALRVALGAAARDAGLHLGDARKQAVADRGAEVGREVEHHALLAERRAGRAERGHLVLGVEVGDLLHGAEERDRLALHERGPLRLEHRDEAHAGARGVVGLRGDEHVQQRFPVMVPPELLLLLRKGAVEQRLDSLRHVFPLPPTPP